MAVWIISGRIGLLSIKIGGETHWQFLRIQMKTLICKINYCFHYLISNQKTFLGIVAQMNKIFNEIIICQMQVQPNFSVVVTLSKES